MPDPVQGMPEGIDLNEPAKPASAAPDPEPVKPASAAPDPSESEPTGAAAPDARPTDGGAWFEKMPQDLHDAVGKFSSPEDLARSYQNLQAITGSSIRIPSQDASAEARQEFLNKLSKAAPELMVKPNMEGENVHEVMRSLGMPEKPDEYVSPEIEGIEIREEDTQHFRDLAHQAGLTNAQYQSMIGNMTRNAALRDAKVNDDFATANANLRNEWGDAYGDRYRAAADIANKTGAPAGVLAAFKEGTVGTEVISWMYDLHKAFGTEGSELTLQEGGANINQGPAEAKAKLEEIMNNKEHAYWKAGHPDHQDAMKRVVDLRTQANPKLSKDPSLLRGTRGINLQ